jgi:hypothetical protein
MQSRWAAFYKGTSSNPKLFELILHLKLLELRHSFTLQIIHVSGHRMQAQGTDGLSRGDLFAGVMRGQPLLSQVPLHLSAIDRSPGVYSWCQSLVPNYYHLLCLSPAQWFTVGHGIQGWQSHSDGIPTPQLDAFASTIYLWAPPPAAANVAMEQLAYSRLKRPHMAHMFVCPRLMTHLWWKQLFKHADFVFSLPVGHRPDVWSPLMFEPLTVGFCLPFLPISPWSRKNTEPVLAVGRQLSSLWETLQGDERPLLRQLWV